MEGFFDRRLFCKAHHSVVKMSWTNIFFNSLFLSLSFSFSFSFSFSYSFSSFFVSFSLYVKWGQATKRDLFQYLLQSRSSIQTAGIFFLQIFFFSIFSESPLLSYDPECAKPLSQATIMQQFLHFNPITSKEGELFNGRTDRLTTK